MASISNKRELALPIPGDVKKVIDSLAHGLVQSTDLKIVSILCMYIIIITSCMST
jgi:hypothetical protein